MANEQERKDAHAQRAPVTREQWIDLLGKYGMPTVEFMADERITEDAPLGMFWASFPNSDAPSVGVGLTAPEALEDLGDGNIEGEIAISALIERMEAHIEEQNTQDDADAEQWRQLISDPDWDTREIGE